MVVSESEVRCALHIFLVIVFSDSKRTDGHCSFLDKRLASVAAETGEVGSTCLVFERTHDSSVIRLKWTVDSASKHLGKYLSS